MYQNERWGRHENGAEEIARLASKAKALGLKNRFGLPIEDEPRTDKLPRLPKLGSSARPHGHKVV